MRISRVRATVALVVSLSLVATATLLGSVPASAFEGYVPTGTFGGEGAAPGQFKAPIGVAIEEPSGDVYVVDNANNRVEKFDVTGKFLLEFNGSETPAKALEGPSYIAVDNSTDASKGDVYVEDASQNVVDVFSASGKYLSQIKIEGLVAITSDSAGHLWAWSSPGFEEYSDETDTLLHLQPNGRGKTPGIVVDSKGQVYVTYGYPCMGRYSPPVYEENNESPTCESTALAINPATNNIFQDEGARIVEWPPFGEGAGGLWSEVAEEITGGFTNSHGLAVNGGTGALYVSDESSNKVEIYRPVITPDVTTEGAKEVSDECATLEAKFNALGTKAEWYFEYGETTAYGSRTAPVSDSNNTSETASTRVCGLSGYSFYHYRLVGANENGRHLGKDAEFRTLPFPPVVEAPGGRATEVNRTRAELTAEIDPSKNQTSYYFEYGETTAYGTRTALTELASSEGDTQPLFAQAVALELKPDRVMHFRVVARNGGGTTFGPDITFTSGSLTPPVVQTGGASNITQSGVTLEGQVTTEGLVTSYGFEISTSAEAFGPPTGLGSVGAGFSEAPATLTLTGLRPATKYFYKLVGSNTDGSSEGTVREFTTAPYPSDQISVEELRVLTEPFTEWPVITKPLYLKAEGKTPAPAKCKRGYAKKNGKCVRRKLRHKAKGKGKKRA